MLSVRSLICLCCNTEGNNLSDCLPANGTLSIRCHYDLSTAITHTHVVARLCESTLILSQANDAFLLTVFVVISARIESERFLNGEDSCCCHDLLLNQSDLSRCQIELEVEDSLMEVASLCGIHTCGLDDEREVLAPLVTHAAHLAKFAEVNDCFELVRTLHVIHHLGINDSSVIDISILIGY